ncbi:ComEC/Rec2 family competence protein, partial [Candidatus Peregrinibacteria bacterium]|nr:ComEC/Rec2 family competence protein [Candidatus Peregrinibacteria bacterium]
LWNPRQLWWDASFQLSFLAVIGIPELQPALKKFLQRVPDALGIRETLTVTLAAQCTALPWASALFGNFPLFSPIANILVAPVIPFIMLTGPIALFGEILNDSLGRILAFPCWVALQWIVRVAEIIASLPLASLPFPKNAGLPLLLYYGALLVFLLQKKYRIRNSLRKL